MFSHQEFVAVMEVTIDAALEPVAGNGRTSQNPEQ